MTVNDERPEKPDYIIVLQVEPGAVDELKDPGDWDGIVFALGNMLVTAIKAGARLLKISKADITDMED